MAMYIYADPTTLPSKRGPMYLKALNQQFPLLQQNVDGSTQPLTFQPPSKTAAGGGGQTPGSPTTATSPTNTNNPSGTPTQIMSTIVVGGPNKWPVICRVALRAGLQIPPALAPSAFGNPKRSAQTQIFPLNPSIWDSAEEVMWETYDIGGAKTRSICALFLGFRLLCMV